MNKGLEALHRLYLTNNTKLPYCKSGECLDDYELVEKELKTLEIIRNKEVNTRGIFSTDSVETYNKIYATFGFQYLTEEEYDLLKEVLL